MAVQQQFTSHSMSPVPPVSWRFSPLPTRIFGLLPEACSSEGSDIELEQKQCLRQIEHERKLRQYEEYRNFLEEQKQQFYLQQQYRSDDEPDDLCYINAKGNKNNNINRSKLQHLVNNIRSEQQNSCLCDNLNVSGEQQCQHGDYVNCTQQCRQNEFTSETNYQPCSCVQEHNKYISENEKLQTNGFNHEQTQQCENYQQTNCDFYYHAEPYEYIDEQYLEEHNVKEDGGHVIVQAEVNNYLTERREDVPLDQRSPEEQEIIGQQGQELGEANGGGRLYCIVESAGSGRLSTYGTMSALSGSSEGMRLELAGVTLDSSTDDLSLATPCGRRNVRQNRNDLSMDSGIQGSSCDLVIASSSSEPEEVIDNDSLNRSIEVTVPEQLTSPASSMRINNKQGGSDIELVHGETFNLVEEVIVVDDSKKEINLVTNKRQHLLMAKEETLDNIVMHSPRSLQSPNHLNQQISKNCNIERDHIKQLTSSPTNICNDNRTPRTLSPVSEESMGDNSTLTLDPATRTYVSYSTPSLDDVTVVEAITKAEIQLGVSDEVYGNGVNGEIIRDTGKSATTVSGSTHSNYFVVVAIDIGTTYSGYAFSFTRDSDSHIHMMRKWEGGDPGLNNQKTPTTLLLSPNGEFHSFGFAARDYFHDLDIQEAKKWLYFDKFKMALHHNQDLNRSTELKAANGHSVPALNVFAHAMRHLKCHALRELSDQTGSNVAVKDVRWVVTVPAIWKHPAKQFMREAAYQAGLCEPDQPEGLLIALEPEAASICCQKLRLNQLVIDQPSEQSVQKLNHASNSTLSLPTEQTGNKLVLEDSREGTRYMVVDCGGGTVDITVHELSECHGTLRELHKATGGPWGSMGVDCEFERLLDGIFEAEFMTQFKLKRPAAYVELMLSFEARKRSASPQRNASLNIFPPFAFIDYYRKFKGKEIEHAVKKYGRKGITWSTQGMLRLQPNVMMELFRPMLDKIIQHIRDVLESPRVNGIKFLFLVGGFAESQILQHEVRKTFDDKVKVIIPQGVSLTILQGAVLFGLNPGLVTVRRSKQTYGVGVLKRFVHGVHPKEKQIIKDGVEWCADVLDKFVLAEQSIGIGETVVRRYTPACSSQKSIVINIYSADSDDAQFITDHGVRRCGTLNLDIPDEEHKQTNIHHREIHTRMVFGGTEVTASALDLATGHTVHAEIDFLTTSTDTEVGL